MFTTEHSRTRTIENQLAEQLKQTWLMLFMGVGIGFVGLHLLIARPMGIEISGLKQALSGVEQRMEELSAANDSVWEANSLLSSLRAQQGQVADARVALQAIRQLRSDLLEVASKNDHVSQAIAGVGELHDRMGELHASMIEHQSVSEKASESFRAIQSLENVIVSQRETHEGAVLALDQMIALKEIAGSQSKEMESAQASLKQLVEISRNLQKQLDDIDKARNGLEGLTALKTGLSDAGQNLEVAQSVSSRLVYLQNRLADGAAKTEIAADRAEQLISLNGKLAGGELNIAASEENLNAMLKMQHRLATNQSNLGPSERNLDGMLKMQNTLVSQTKMMADAIQTLELLTGFRDELAAQIRSLSDFRRDLIEISLMETSIAKVARMMKPLAELGNLRRLSDDELRHAARSILDGRTATRMSTNFSESRPGPVSETSGEGAATEYVPMPTDD